MINMLLSMSIMNSLMNISMKHPMSLGSTLLIQTALLTMMAGFLYMNLWYSYIMFLIMIGGLLVLFMYMTSIASNEKFLMPTKFMIIIPATIILYMTTKTFNPTYNSMSMKFNMTVLTQESFSKFLSSKWMITLIMMIYLIIAMIATVKISYFKSGSIRQMN
uniref:NADH dehydrogenase subunit 6 n=1 Tax=Leiochrinini sp. 2 ACP-2013 TaxID=1434620 RepID=A0A3G3FWX2_9CUCU|nr:NADH dehydrogenase subunit 6 [Leiochrinini sp. 2 ACP-2013]